MKSSYKLPLHPAKDEAMDILYEWNIDLFKNGKLPSKLDLKKVVNSYDFYKNGQKESLLSKIDNAKSEAHAFYQVCATLSYGLVQKVKILNSGVYRHLKKEGKL